jgi:hypothetical protein
MIKLLIALCLSILTFGCATPEENIAIARKKHQDKTEKERIYILELQNRCENFGFKKDTKRFANCMMIQRKNDYEKSFREGLLKDQAEERSRKQWRDLNESLKPRWIPETK